MVEEYQIVEVKPGIYVAKGISGHYRLTDKLKEARRFDEPGTARNVAREYFGEVKGLKITWEVE